jgi:hypothetical protein
LPSGPGVVRSATLEETAQGWTGASDIRWHLLEDADVAAVALAGILAEAKGAALSLDEHLRPNSEQMLVLLSLADPA